VADHDVTFGEALKARVTANLAGFVRHTIAPDGRRPAAVAAVLLPDDDWRACFLLTRRTATLRAHARQWALPGGRIDAGETSEEAALRELREEVGLALDASSVLGLLDDYGTRSGFIITPVVALVSPGHAIRLNAFEVADAFEEPDIAKADVPGEVACRTGAGIGLPIALGVGQGGDYLLCGANLALEARHCEIPRGDGEVFAIGWRTFCGQGTPFCSGGFSLTDRKYPCEAMTNTRRLTPP